MHSDTIDRIRDAHRRQRFALKMQSRADRSLEAFIRWSIFGFSTFEEEKERSRKSRAALQLIKKCRAGEHDPEFEPIAAIVLASDQGRAGWDRVEAENAKTMRKLARTLPGFSFVHEVRGASEYGLAQIVGEAGDLAAYPNPGKLWKRLGLAPYDGLAMSSWLRKTWRPRTLTAEEWIANPFKPERYAIMRQIAEPLFRSQWKGRDKDDPESVGSPTGYYGEVYAHRRTHTALTHPDWTPGHAHADGLRYMLKRFIRHLWCEWRRRANEALKPRRAVPAAESSEEAEL